jgi:4-hydroxybenzoate polyprenyltransferase
MTMPSNAMALIRSSHPGPTLLITAIAAVLGLVLGYEAWRLLLLAATVCAAQLSIGWSNDWIDAERDRAVSRPDKPVASGTITASAVRAAAFSAAAASVALSLLLGWPAALANALAGAMGWFYNAGLKNTLLSPLPYVICFGLIPAIATLGMQPPRFPFWWAITVGALLGVAAHFTNVLPDLRDDRATGVRGLPHLMGAKGAGTAAFLLLVAAAAVLIVGCLPHPGIALWAGLGIDLGIAVIGLILLGRGTTTRLLMRLIMTAALLDVLMLAFSGHPLAA